MKTFLNWYAICWLSGVILAAACTSACHSGQTAQNGQQAAVYEAELMSCIERAHTLQESQACRCEVNKRWDRACTPDVIGVTEAKP